MGDEIDGRGHNTSNSKEEGSNTHACWIGLGNKDLSIAVDTWAFIGKISRKKWNPERLVEMKKSKGCYGRIKDLQFHIHVNHMCIVSFNNTFEMSVILDFLIEEIGQDPQGAIKFVDLSLLKKSWAQNEVNWSLPFSFVGPPK